MAEQLKQQPAFVKINQLRPGAFGLNLTVKVVSSKAIMTRGRNGTQGRNMRLAECLVGDETGIVVFTARNDQGMIYLNNELGLQTNQTFGEQFVNRSAGSSFVFVRLLINERTRTRNFVRLVK
ncbi:putative nucleic acid-binding protein [Helianthus annuus]|nr:putative nucleic acid-binding protein [Helianthus annuus]